jgi:hypothetical protein
MFFFIVALPVSRNEDSTNEFPFCPALGSNASFAGSNLLTNPLPGFEHYTQRHAGTDLIRFCEMPFLDPYDPPPKSSSQWSILELPRDGNAS